MAKRKRLTPAQPSYLSAPPTRPGPGGGSSSVGSAPIAQVASDTAAAAALQELSGVLETARTKGLIIEELPLAAIDETYLVRDRIVQNEEDMSALMDSLRARGQQTPVEVVRLEVAKGGVSHGLISGWRRLTALRRLYAETSDPRFATIRAMVVRPESAADAYVAMVEENEIRVNLSHYERARIAKRALEQGIYPDQRKALLGLFMNVPRAKRSKIASFVTLVGALDGTLRFPTAIPEKLGLSLAAALERDPALGALLVERLRAAPADQASDELALLQAALEPTPQIAASDRSDRGPEPGHGAFDAPRADLETESVSAGFEPDHGRPEDGNTPARAFETPPQAHSEALPVPPVAPAKDPQEQPAGVPDRSAVEARPTSEPAGAALQPRNHISSRDCSGVEVAFQPEARRIELSGEGVSEALVLELRAWLANR